SLTRFRRCCFCYSLRYRCTCSAIWTSIISAALPGKMRMSETLSLFFDALVTCLQAAPLTLMLTALSVGIGLCMAIPLSVVHQRERTPGARLVHAFTYFFTGTPLLVQIYKIGRAHV